MNFLTNLAAKYLKRKGFSLTDAKVFMEMFSSFYSGDSSSNYAGWVAACADVWGKTFTKGEFKIYDKTNNEEVEGHQFYELISKPNDFQTWWEIRYRIAQNFIVYGNSYLLKLRDNLGVPRGLVQLHPDRITTLPVGVEKIDSYQYQAMSLITIPKEDVIHFRYPDPDSLIEGRPVINNVLNQLEVDKFQTAYQKKFYKESGFMGLTFTTDQKMSTDSFNRMKEELRSNYGGDSNAYKVALFEQGLTPIPAAYGMKDMDIGTQRALTQKEILNAFQVNKLLLGESEQIQRGNADTVFYVFYSMVADPLLSYIDEVLTTQLCWMDYDMDFYIKHDELANRDIELDLKYYANGLGSGWLTPNEIREAEGFGRIEGGDEIRATNVQDSDLGMGKFPLALQQIGLARTRAEEVGDKELVEKLGKLTDALIAEFVNRV